MSLSIDEIIVDVQDKLPETSIVRKIGKHFSRGHSEKLYVVTPYWRAKILQFPMRILKRRILSAGHSCLMYQFPTKILSDNVHLTEQYFKEIEKEIKKNIEEIKKKHNFQEIVLLGMSLGCVNALMVSNKNQNVNKVLLVVPGDSLSDSLWRGLRTKKLKDQIAKRHVNLKELEKDWQELDPQNNIDDLAGKYIEVYLSKSDKIIPYRNGEHLVVDMKKIGLNPIVKKNDRLGHYFTVMKFILSKKF